MTTIVDTTRNVFVETPGKFPWGLLIIGVVAAGVITTMIIKK